MGMTTAQHFHTLSLHLVPFCQLTHHKPLHVLSLFIPTKLTRYSALLYIFTHKRQSMYSSNKFSQRNLNSNIPRPRGIKFEVVRLPRRLPRKARKYFAIYQVQEALPLLFEDQLLKKKCKWEINGVQLPISPCYRYILGLQRFTACMAVHSINPAL